jgi:hypothetical protein
MPRVPYIRLVPPLSDRRAHVFSMGGQLSVYNCCRVRLRQLTLRVHLKVLVVLTDIKYNTFGIHHPSNTYETSLTHVIDSAAFRFYLGHFADLRLFIRTEK